MEYVQAVILGGSILVSGVWAYIMVCKEFAKYTIDEEGGDDK